MIFGVAEVLAFGFEQDHGAAFGDKDEVGIMVALGAVDAECTRLARWVAVPKGDVVERGDLRNHLPLKFVHRAFLLIQRLGQPRAEWTRNDLQEEMPIGEALDLTRLQHLRKLHFRVGVDMLLDPFPDLFRVGDAVVKDFRHLQLVDLLQDFADVGFDVLVANRPKVTNLIE